MNESMREQAHEKMLAEIKDSKSSVAERLHVWLCNTDDEELIQTVLKPDRNLNQATEYLYAKGSKIAHKGVADVTQEMEQAWAREYYLPSEKGETIEKEVIKEVEKVVYRTPTAEDIGAYLMQQKQSKKKGKSETEKEEQESLFDL